MIKSLSSAIERRVANYLRHRGYVVGKGRADLDQHPDRYLSELPRTISTLIDLSDWDEAPVIYNLFADKKIVVVDPLPRLKQRATRLQDDGFDIVPINAGVGIREGEAVFESSWPLPKLLALFSRRKALRIAPLDRLIAEHKLPGPFGLILGAGGNTSELLQGATVTLQSTLFVVSIIHPHTTDRQHLSDVGAMLALHGFWSADPKYRDHGSVASCAVNVRPGSTPQFVAGETLEH